MHDVDWTLRRSFRRQRLSLLQHILYRGILQVGGIPILAQDALHQNAHTGAGSFAIQSTENDTAAVPRITRHLRLPAFRYASLEDRAQPTAVRAPQTAARPCFPLWHRVNG
jgi:hypothetical protein